MSKPGGTYISSKIRKLTIDEITKIAEISREATELFFLLRAYPTNENADAFTNEMTKLKEIFKIP